MKMTSLNFISQYLTPSWIEYITEYYIKDNGKSAYQPAKWTNENAKVPRILRKSEDAKETLWILIRYPGAYDTLYIDDYREEHEIRDEYQRAIAIDFTDDSVTWTMFCNNRNPNKKCMKSFKRKYEAANA